MVDLQQKIYYIVNCKGLQMMIWRCQVKEKPYYYRLKCI